MERKDIFLCYRERSAGTAKNFKKFVDEQSQSMSHKNSYGEVKVSTEKKVRYSDKVVSGVYIDENEIKNYIFDSKYFIIFLYKGFTKKFLNFLGRVNKNCATALELWLAEKARKEKGLQIIFVNEYNEKLSTRDYKRLYRVFKQKKVFYNDTKIIWEHSNNNNHYPTIFNHDVRQADDIDFYKRILSGIEPKVNFQKVEFGSYPKTLIKDRLLLTQLNSFITNDPTIENFDGWNSFNYFYEGKQRDLFLYKDVTYNGNKYRVIYSFEMRPFLSNVKKSYLNKVEFEIKTKYWFRYDKISWKILDEKEGLQYLLADEVLDSQPINNSVEDINGISANEYEESSIYKWLNDIFYNTAFTTEEKKEIHILNQKNLLDKEYVSLLRKEDVEKYLIDKKDRCLDPTDYAIYQGVYKSYYADWFLKTKYEYSDTDMYYVCGYDASIKEDLVIYTNGGVVPVICRKKTN